MSCTSSGSSRRTASGTTWPDPGWTHANLGNGRAVLLSVVTQLVPYVGYPRALNALNCIDEILKG